MRDIARLMEGVYEAFRLGSDGAAKPFAPTWDGGRLVTHCNEAVNLIAMKMGYDKFDRRSATKPWGALDADQMYDVMSNPTSGWRVLPHAQAAQEAANWGNLVVAAYKNDAGHGHVCVVVPGLLEPSSTWGSLAPKVMNIGKDVFMGKKASFAFGKAEMPVYFTLGEGQ